MADLPYTICFRAGPELKEWLKRLAAENHRKLGDVVRLLLEKCKHEIEQELNGKVQSGHN
jgi:hypothetical protein